MAQQNYPRHIAIIMDGNGRWAKVRGLSRLDGHVEGTKRVEEIIEEVHKLRIPYLTLYAFSKENWARPPEEVQALMKLLDEFLLAKKKRMIKNKIRFNTIGDIASMPASVRDRIHEIKEATQGGDHMVLTLALSYGGRDEILRAVERAREQAGKLDEAGFAKYLDTHDLPDPDLIIRTSGEHRLSNFLIWQSAYTEFFFDDCPWPEFRADHLHHALQDYQSRERRFGLISEQVQS